MYTRLAAAFCGAVLFAVAADGDPIAVVQYAQCETTVGTSSCFSNNAIAYSGYSDSVSGSPGPVTANINGTALSFPVEGGAEGLVISEIDMTVWLTTAGNVRPGKLNFSAGITADGSQSSFGGEYSISGITDQTCFSDCSVNSTAAFTLGQPFEIELKGFAFANGNFSSNASYTGTVIITAQDPHGHPVTILPYLTPEPGTAASLAAGLSIVALCFIRRKTRPQPQSPRVR